MAKEDWRELVAAAWTEFAVGSSGHLRPEELIEYHTARLTDEAREKVESHLARCAECLEHLADMSDFIQSVAKGEGPADEKPAALNFEALWRQLQRREPAAPDASTERETGFWSNPRVMVALAASLFIAFALTGIGALTLWQENQRLAGLRPTQPGGTEPWVELERRNRELQAQLRATQGQAAALEQENRRLQDSLSAIEQRYEQQLAQLKQPEVNVPVVNIYPRDERQRSQDAAHVNQIRVPPGTRRFTVILGDYKRGYQQYRIEIVDQTGRVMWPGGGLKPDQVGDLTVMLDRAFLGLERYTIRLYGGNERIADYDLRIE